MTPDQVIALLGCTIARLEQAIQALTQQNAEVTAERDRLGQLLATLEGGDLQS